MVDGETIQAWNLHSFKLVWCLLKVILNDWSGVHILPFLGSLCPSFYLQSTSSIPKPIDSDVLEHQGQPTAGSTSNLESTESNETFKQPQDGKDTLQQTTPQQLAGNIDEHKPPVDTAITTNTQSYSGAKLLDTNIEKTSAAASAVPTEQGLSVSCTLSKPTSELCI